MATERACVVKGVAYPSPLVILHPEPTSHSRPQFERHSTMLYRHLLARLFSSLRYHHVLSIGLEDGPRDLSRVDKCLFLDGFTDPLRLGVHGDDSPPPVLQLDLSSPEACLESIKRAVQPAIQAAGGRQQEGEDEAALAVGIDSLGLLMGYLGVKAGLGVLKALRRIRGLSPIVTVLQADDLTGPVRSAVEGLATTNIYVQRCTSHQHQHHADHGRCLVVRRSQSGKVNEEWEWYVLGEGEGKVSFSEQSTCPLAAGKRVVAKAGEAGGAQQETAFLESLPFRLSLNDQEKVMRGQTVLPHQQRVGLQGDSSEAEYLAEEDDDDEEDLEGVDDDLDI